MFYYFYYIVRLSIQADYFSLVAVRCAPQVYIIVHQRLCIQVP